MITPEQIIAIGDSLRANPRSYADLQPQERELLHAALRPHRITGWHSQQYHWINLWWLGCTAQQVEQLESIQQNQFLARTDDHGKLYLRAAVLTDAVEGRRLAAALPILETMVLWHTDDLDWPEEISEL